MLTRKVSSAKMRKSEVITYKIVKKIDIPRPKRLKVLKVRRAPKMTIAHDAPSKKLMILS